MKKFAFSLISLITVGNLGLLQESIALGPSKTKLGVENFFGNAEVESRNIAINTEQKEKNNITGVKNGDNNNLGYIYLDKNSDYSKKEESISTQFSAKPKSGIFGTISKALSSVVGFFKSFFSSKHKAREIYDETDRLVMDYLAKNIGESFVILGKLETENYTLAWCSKEDKISSETQNFFEKFNKEVVKPENEILKSFGLNFDMEEFKRFPILKVANKNGEIVGWVRVLFQFNRVEFIPLFFNEEKARNALTEIITNFSKELKKVLDFEEIKEIYRKKGKEMFETIGEEKDVVENALDVIAKKFGIYVALIGFVDKNGTLDETYNSFLSKLAENLKKSSECFSEIEIKKTADFGAPAYIFRP